MFLGRDDLVQFNRLFSSLTYLLVLADLSDGGTKNAGVLNKESTVYHTKVDCTHSTAHLLMYTPCSTQSAGASTPTTALRDFPVFFGKWNFRKAMCWYPMLQNSMAATEDVRSFQGFNPIRGCRMYQIHTSRRR